MSSFEMIIFLVLFSFIGLCKGQAGGDAGGGQSGAKYVLNFNSAIYGCSDDISVASVNTSELEVISHNETFSTISGIMLFKKSLPEKAFRIEIIVQKKVSGSYETLLTKEICDLCDELGPNSDLAKYLVYFGVPKECPFPAGPILVFNFVPGEDDLPLDATHEGFYEITIFAHENLEGDCDNHENKKFLFCLKLRLTVEQYN